MAGKILIFGNGGSAADAQHFAAELVVKFEKKGEKIYLRQESFSNIAKEIDPISVSVTKNNFSPIIASFKILNKEKNRYLIDVSSFFLKDSPGFNIIRKNIMSG